MRRDLVLALLIAAAAFAIRTYPAWDSVFTDAGVNFFETDAWYHVRLVENQVRNFPWRITRDPFAAPGGQFVPIAPLFDTVTATIVVLMYGRQAATPDIERIAAMMPPLYGTLTILVVWALAQRLFDRRAGLLAAALLAVLPGHFMDRTMLGFVDHHALEALLAVTVLFTFALALPHVERARQFTRISALWAGGALGLYLLAWGSGAFLIAVIGVWLLVCVPLARTTSDLTRAATVTAISCAVALVLVVAFQDPAMLRYGSQVLGLAGLGAAALAIQGATQLRMALPPKRVVLGAIAAVALVTAAAAATFARGVVSEALIDVGRLAPDASRMGVLEARPLFMYSGNWNWLQPWLFFRTGFFIGVIALIPFTARVWRQRLMADSLLLMFAMATLVATIGQNRFGYYFVTACAVLGGWLAVELLDWAGVPHAGNPTPRARTKMPLAREVAVVVVAGGMFAPNLSPRVLLAERTASFPTYWRDTMRWLREQTPPPFQNAAGAGGDYYYARYPKDVALAPDYSVMSWWDQGYWITQQARRVPVANPTQERAPNAARFYSATDEARALEILRAERSRYVVSDYELPFRRLADGTIMGRFQTIVDWTGAAHAPFYEVIYRRSEGGGWNAAWIFHEPYYRSMAFRLSALGGVGATPANTTSVITVADRVDTNGVRFRELLTEHTYATYEAARIAAQSTTGGIVVGLDPWQSAFPIEPLQSLVQVHAATTPEQTRSEAPWVRVFEVR